MNGHQRDQHHMRVRHNTTLGSISGHLDTTIRGVSQNSALWNEMYLGESAFHLHSQKTAASSVDDDLSPASEHLREDEKRAWQDPTLVDGYVAHREQWL